MTLNIFHKYFLNVPFDLLTVLLVVFSVEVVLFCLFAFVFVVVD